MLMAWIKLFAMDNLMVSKWPADQRNIFLAEFCRAN